ncbi:hypothetical protein EPO05_06825, partial [Patescibacteria group bacterium]
YIITTKAKDSKGMDVSAESYFMLYDQKERSYPFQQFATCMPIKSYCKKGENAEILLGTSVDHAVFNLIHEYEGRIIKTETIELNREQKLISFPISLDKNIPYMVHIYMVNNNNVYSTSQYFYLDDDSDLMEIELVTFRDKLLPGQDEEWKVKLKGNVKQDIPGAEILANMYDASLDELSYYNSWNYYFFNYSYTTYYLGQTSFNSTSNAYGYSYIVPAYEAYRYKTFETLNYFGWATGYNPNNYYYRYSHDLNPDYTYSWSDDLEGDNRRGYGDYKNGDKINEEDFGALDGAYDQTMTKSEGGKETNIPVLSTGNTITLGGSFSEKDANGRFLPQQQQPRINFNETAFFFPHLVTDEKGEVSFSFKVPESLTKWKFRALATTKDLKT